MYSVYGYPVPERELGNQGMSLDQQKQEPPLQTVVRVDSKKEAELMIDQGVIELNNITFVIKGFSEVQTTQALEKPGK